MNRMTIHDVRRVGQNRLEYVYTTEGDWSRFFDMSSPMWAEYSIPVEQVPDSIAVLPLIGNVIVLASLMDADIYVDEIDRDFYDCIEEFLQGYDEIMPDHVHFKTRDIVHPQRIVDNPLSETEQAENLLFFSGGVDATCSLVTHITEKPALVTIWGADIHWEKEDLWNRAIAFNQEVADRHDLKLLTIRSNFRMSLNNDALEDYSMKLVHDWWWSAFHHSVSMMCLAAPLAAGNRKHLYFGSTYSQKDSKEWGTYVTASDPLIDNHVHFSGCQVVHDGYEYSRLDKIKCIDHFYADKELKPYLRVCYLSNTGRNCCKCEKCASTIMALLLAGSNPVDYGFDYDPERFPEYFAAGVQEMGRAEKYAFLSFYYDIHGAYRQKHTREQVHPTLRAFYDTELDVLADFLFVPNNELAARDQSIRQHEAQLYREIGQLNYQLQVQQNQLGQLLQEKEICQEQCRMLTEQRNALQQENHTWEETVFNMCNSVSWRLTKLLRWMAQKIRAVKQKLCS